MANDRPKVRSPKASPVMSKNLVEEKIIRYTAPESELGAGQSTEAYHFEGSAGDLYEVRSGEAVELIALGVKAQDNLESITIKDDNNTEWNTFFTGGEYQQNTLPFYQSVDFEERLLDWGYNSFDSKHVRNIVQGVMKGDRPREDLKAANIAPTLKLGEGDSLKVFAQAKSDNAVSTDVPIYAKIRRYKNGYPVDYSNFHEYDGGLESNKQYYEDFGQIDSTETGKWTPVYRKQVLKNEAFKFYSAGVWATPNLMQAKINIDDGRVEKDRYFTNPDYNMLPFVDQYEMEDTNDDVTDLTVNRLPIHSMHRFRPTIDIVKDNNEDITLSVKDDGTSADDVVARVLGIRHRLA